jgi:cation diffusion facilitator CzcD-associated flavoprotein CzcO
VYRNTHTITSREVTGYADFPMSSELPVYPRHEQVLDYLRDYADHFQLRRHFRFGAEVVSVKRIPGGWQVITSEGKVTSHSAVIIANGHNWSPQLPDFPGTYTGKMLHSRDYDSAAEFSGQRVLVVGAGNSGCDIAVETAQVAERVSISMRRGYYFFPKFLAGRPADQVGESSQSLRLPLPLVRTAYRIMLRFTVGSPQQFGLPKPDHKPLESPPIVNSLLPYYCAHDRVRVRPGIARLDGKRVEFTDGTSEEFDAIVLATGFSIHIPFMERAQLDWKQARPDFYLLAFSPSHDDLFIAGMTDGTGGHFPTVDLQSQVIAAYIAAKEDDPAAIIRFEKLRNGKRTDLTGGIQFLDTPRNATQFELITYQRTLRKHLRSLEPSTRRARSAKPGGPAHRSVPKQSSRTAVYEGTSGIPVTVPETSTSTGVRR